MVTILTRSASEASATFSVVYRPSLALRVSIAWKTKIQCPTSWPVLHTPKPRMFIRLWHDWPLETAGWVVYTEWSRVILPRFRGNWPDTLPPGWGMPGARAKYLGGGCPIRTQPCWWGLHPRITSKRRSFPILIKKHGFYGIVRHPMYLGGIIFFTASMTDAPLPPFLGYLILAIYMMIGTVREDRRLSRELGNVYRNYQKEVPMILPRIPGRKTWSFYKFLLNKISDLLMCSSI